MKKDEHFWWTTLIRGFLALIIGSLVLVIPDMARILLLQPIAIAVAILGLAAYGVLDSVLIFVTSYMTDSRPAKLALRVQGLIGAAVGVLLYIVLFDQIELRWFLLIIAVQSLSTAIGEFLLARHSPTHATSLWNRASAIVAFLFSVVYLYLFLAISDRLIPEEISWLAFGYLLTFGTAQCLTAARMLYAEQHLAHRTHIHPIHQEA